MFKVALFGIIVQKVTYLCDPGHRNNPTFMKISTVYRASKSIVYLRVNADGSETLVKLFNIDKKYWNTKTKQVKPSYPNAQALNNEMFTKKQMAADIAQANNYTSVKEFKEHITKHGWVVRVSRSDIMVDYINRKRAECSYNRAKNYSSLIHHLNAFEPDITINKWTKLKLRDFEHYLNTHPKNYSSNYKVRLLSDLRAILNELTFYDFIQIHENPFKLGYKTGTFKPKDVKLELHELQQMWEASPYNYYAAYFMLMFFCDGARPNEVIKLKWDHIKDGKIRYTQSKTDKPRTVTITPHLQKVLDYFQNDSAFVLNKYQANKERGQVEVERALMKLNEGLKEVCTALDITHVSSHCARHTFAYLANENGYSITDIQNSLSHSKINQTAEYIGKNPNDKLIDKRQQLHNQLHLN